MKVKIIKTGINGEGIGYINKTPVFIPGALVDEIVDIEVVEKNRRYMRGECKKIIKKSKHRQQPLCKIQHRCGGCAFMISDYETQLQGKYEILKQSLIKYAQVNPRLIKKVIPSEHIYRYRNQCKLPCNMKDETLVTGMYVPNSNYFCDIDRCIIHNKSLEIMRKKVLDCLNLFHLRSYDYHQKKGIRNLIIRGFQNEFQVTIVSGEHPLEQEVIDALMNIDGLVSLWQSYNTVKKSHDIFGSKMIFLAGKKTLTMNFDGLQLQLSPRSFFQLNTQQAKILYRSVANLVQGNYDLIVEAYSGIGAISLYLKDKAKEIIGIESVKEAVINANENAKLNQAEHIHFICDDAANKLTYISKKRNIDLLIMDPPRTGLDDAMLSTILKSKISDIIYISCNPATLGKDLSILQQRYRVVSVTALDMFPNTPHVETITLLRRQ